MDGHSRMSPGGVHGLGAARLVVGDAAHGAQGLGVIRLAMSEKMVLERAGEQGRVMCDLAVA